MRIVLDANEYILGLMPGGDPACRRLLTMVALRSWRHELRIARMIVDEVQSNLADEESAKFYRLLAALTVIDEEWAVPQELCQKYASAGLKASDALIAAYTEQVDADYLVSENRHFLSRREHMPFGVVSAEEFVRVLEGAGDD